MKLKWKRLLCWFDPNLDNGYLYALSWKKEIYLAGHLVGQPTASWFDSKTKRSTSSGFEKVFMTILRVVGRNYSATQNTQGVLLQEKGQGSETPTMNHAQKTPSNFMFVVTSAAVVQQGSAYLTVSLYKQILEECLAPFLNQVDTSRRAQAFPHRGRASYMTVYLASWIYPQTASSK